MGISITTDFSNIKFSSSSLRTVEYQESEDSILKWKIGICEKQLDGFVSQDKFNSEEDKAMSSEEEEILQENEALNKKKEEMLTQEKVAEPSNEETEILNHGSDHFVEEEGQKLEALLS